MGNTGKEHASGAKALAGFAGFMYGLKPVPFKARLVPVKVKPVFFLESGFGGAGGDVAHG